MRKEVNKVKEVIGVQLQSTSLFELFKVEEILHLYASFYPKNVDIDQLIEDMLLTEKRKDRIKRTVRWAEAASGDCPRTDS